MEQFFGARANFDDMLLLVYNLMLYLNSAHPFYYNAEITSICQHRCRWL